jgi:competence protein ComEC
MHLLALSGMHLAVLAGLLGMLLFPLIGRPAGVVASLLLALYFWIVGPFPSLLRALLMFSLGAAVKLAGRGVDPRSLLAGALLIGLILAPSLATSLGWRLSTLALLGILWIGAPLWARGPALPPRRLWSLLWVSLGAFLATTPTSLATFGEAYPASILSSILLTPLVLLFIWVALFSVPLLSLAPTLTLPLGGLGGALYAILEESATVLARLRPLSGASGTRFWALAMGTVLLLLLAPWIRALISGRE